MNWYKKAQSKDISLKDIIWAIDNIIIELPKYNRTYEGLSARIGIGKNIYRILFRRRGNNLVSTIILNDEALPSRSFNMLQENPSEIVNEIKEKIKGFSWRSQLPLDISSNGLNSNV